jgi:hypothetical protein
MADNVIYVFRGDNKTVRLTVYQSDAETVYNLALCTVTLYIKKKASDHNDEAILTKVGTITQAANGKVEFYFVPADTTDNPDLKDDKAYFYNVLVKNSSYTPAKYYTAVKSRFVIFQP